MTKEQDRIDRERLVRQLTTAKIALATAIWHVDRAVDGNRAGGFRAVAESLQQRIEQWIDAGKGGDSDAG